MIFVYLLGSFDDLKIQIIDEYDENNENNIYSPFNTVKWPNADSFFLNFAFFEQTSGEMKEFNV